MVPDRYVTVELTCRLVDCGIGYYEFHGCHGYHSNWQWEAEDYSHNGGPENDDLVSDFIEFWSDSRAVENDCNYRMQHYFNCPDYDWYLDIIKQFDEDLDADKGRVSGLPKVTEEF